MYFVPSGKSLQSIDQDQVPIILAITAASWDFGRQSDWDLDTKRKILKIHLFVNCMTTADIQIVNTDI
jgi:hypothetical protein